MLDANAVCPADTFGKEPLNLDHILPVVMIPAGGQLIHEHY